MIIYRFRITIVLADLVSKFQTFYYSLADRFQKQAIAKFIGELAKF